MVVDFLCCSAIKNIDMHSDFIIVRALELGSQL